MSSELFLSCPVPPSVNHYLALRAFIKNGRPVAMSYKTAVATKYQEELEQYVIEEVAKQGWELEPNKHQHFYADAVFYFRAIDQDANNYFKLLLDAITNTKAIWLDDNVVCERVNRIMYNSENPHIDLHIYPVDYIGIFDNANQLEEFKANNCIGCTRYKRNCSLLISAIEGRIHGEYTNQSCSSRKVSKAKTSKKGNKKEICEYEN